MSRILHSLLAALFLLPVAASGATAPAPVAPIRSVPAPSVPSRPATVPSKPAGAPAASAAATPTAQTLVHIWRRNGILVEQGGRALYTFEKDPVGESRCNHACEALWPPHFAEPGAKAFGPFTLATSYTGRPMWAWKGQPLYRWISDRKRGAAGGDGVADVWFLVRVPAAMNDQVPMYRPMPTPRRVPLRPAPTAAPIPGTSP